MQVQERVEKFVHVRPHTLDSDTDLYCEYMNYFHNCGITKEQIAKMKIVPFETITRIRRKICKLPQFKASKEVEEMRQKKYEEMTSMYGGRNPMEAIKNKRDKEKQMQTPLPF